MYLYYKCENGFLVLFLMPAELKLYTRTWRIDASDYPASINTKQQTKKKNIDNLFYY